MLATEGKGRACDLVTSYEASDLIPFNLNLTLTPDSFPRKSAYTPGNHA